MNIARATARELVGRKVLMWGAGLSAAFVGLYTLGLILLQREVSSELDTFAVTVMAILALYVVSFLGSFLGMALSSGSVAAEIEGGLIHAVLARPISRRRWLAERWAAVSAIVSVYTVAMAWATMALADAVLAYRPGNLGAVLGFLALEVVVMVTLGTYFSTKTSSVATGVILFASFGIAWMGGIVEFVGRTLSNDTMVDVGIVTSLLMPTDGLWRAASYHAANASYLSEIGPGLPLASSAPPAAAFIGWSLGYVLVFWWAATRVFERRDL